MNGARNNHADRCSIMPFQPGRTSNKYAERRALQCKARKSLVARAVSALSKGNRMDNARNSVEPASTRLQLAGHKRHESGTTGTW
ncbi:hypothetical protein SUGI_0977070 [Cryptomeria japonica]|nr:hypothetical protein SUGI_0977070 [Cryptomeria japonica]